MNTRAAVMLTDTYVAAARLRCRRGQWTADSVHRVPADTPATLHPGVDAERLAPAIAQAAQSTGTLNVAVDLIIPATWCFIRKLDLPDRRFRAATAAYQFEEFLPLTLEEVTCAFARDRAHRVWAVAVPTGPLKLLLNHLEAQRVAVEHIRVDLFAALAAADSPPDGAAWVILSDARRAAFALRNDSRHLPELMRTAHRPPNVGAEFLERQIALTETVAASHPNARVACHLWAHNTGTGAEPGKSTDAGIPSGAETGATPSVCLSDLLLASAAHPDQPDLRTGELAAANRLDGVFRKASRCAALLLMLLAILTGTAHWRRADCTRQLADVRQGQLHVYRQILPAGPVPPSPSMRLASERKRLEGLTNTTTGSTEPKDDRQPPRLALMNDLREFVATLPDDVRVRLLELSIDAHQFRALGQTADHQDAERITEAVHAIAGLDVRPPRTSRLNTGAVEFSIYAPRDRDAD